MAKAKGGVVHIQAVLVAGYHDALLTLLGGDNRRMANSLALTISEACIDVWPIQISDYDQPGPGEQQPVKIALNSERFPRLYAIYSRLSSGAKGQTLVNLMNRHQMLKDTDPEAANAALNKLHNSWLDAPAAAAQEVRAQPVIAPSLSSQEVVVPSTPEGTAALTSQPAEADVIKDPLSSVGPMSF